MTMYKREFLLLKSLVEDLLLYLAAALLLGALWNSFILVMHNLLGAEALFILHKHPQACKLLYDELDGKVKNTI